MDRKTIKSARRYFVARGLFIGLLFAILLPGSLTAHAPAHNVSPRTGPPAGFDETMQAALCEYNFLIRARPSFVFVQKARSSDANLSNLSLSQGGLSPAFSGGNTSYAATVDNTITTVMVTPTTDGPAATVTVNGQPVTSGMASDPVALNIGQNTITVVVTAQDGITINTYTITMTRAQSSDAILNNLTLSQGNLSPAFSGGNTNYTSSVIIAKKEHTIYTMGDSITAFGEYQSTLDSLLNEVFNFVNLGIAGDRTPGMLGRFGAVTAASPDYVIILGGINDINGKAGTALVEGNLQAMYTAAHNAGSKVIALTITPEKGNPNWTALKQTVQDSVNAWIPLAKNVDYVVDTYSALADPSNPGQLLPAYDTSDHLHPSQAGQKVMASLIFAGVAFTPNPVIDQINAANTTVSVIPVTDDANATVTVNGNTVAPGTASLPFQLSLGPNNIITNVTAQDGTNKTYNVNVTGAPSTNSSLAYVALTSGGITLTPVFASNITAYTTVADHDSTSLKVRPTTMDGTATVTVNGMAVVSGQYSLPVPLVVGPNTITIVVTAQDGITRTTYTIIETRLPVNLKNIQLSSGTISPAFLNTETAYTSSVAYPIASITVTPTAADATETITVNGVTVKSGNPSAPIPLTVGSNTVTIVATEGGSTASYTLTETRLPSTNANLELMRPGSGAVSPSFSSTVTSYTSTVVNTITSITITPNTADPNATVTINGMAVTLGTASGAIPLMVGPNTISTVVTAQDGVTQKTYTLVETRLPSANANLELMKPGSGTVSPAFSSAITSYTSSVANTVSSITITPNTAEPNATVTINGQPAILGIPSSPVALAVGPNTITTTVTAQDGVTTKSYTLTITRAPASSDASLSNLQLSNGTLSPAFIASTYNYSTGVGFGLNTMTVTPSVTVAGATVTVNGLQVSPGTPSQFLPLAVGNNTVTIVVTALDGVTTQTYTLVINEARSPNNNLAALAISNGVLSPAFTAGTTGYTASVISGVSSITVTPTTADATATVAVNGSVVTPGAVSNPIPLAVGVNTISVAVTAQNQTAKTYTITVTRASPFSDASLSGLLLSNGDLGPVFAAATYNYTTVVGYGLTTMTVTPTSDAATAAITVNGAAVASGTPSSFLPLVVGPNTFNIVVTAQDGVTTQTYTLVITESRSPNNYLTGLTLSDGALSPVFAVAATSYMASVGNSVSAITISPTTADAAATVTVNGSAVTSGAVSNPIALAVGPNTITTVVTAQNQTTKTYILTVTRAPSSNAALLDLTLSQGTISPAFTGGITAYAASVANNVTSVTLGPVTADATATVTVNGVPVTTGTPSGDIQLNAGANTIVTQVTAQDGVTVNTYTIIVTRAPSANAGIANLALSAGAISPAFAPAVNSYSANVDNSVASLSVTVIAADPTATITINGVPVSPGVASAPFNLNVGENTIAITLTAQDGVTVNTDTIIITRAPSSNAGVANITLGQGTLSPAFAGGTTSYTATVASAAASVTATTTALDETASITVNGLAVTSGSPSAAIALNYGQNTIIIQVTAQDGITTSGDTISVTRPLSTNANLASLSLGEGAISPAFVGNINNYTANVATSVTAITVKPTLADPTATVTVNGAPVAPGAFSSPITLAGGSTIVTVQVTAQDGVTVDTYMISATNTALSNAALAGLTLSQGVISPLFDTGTNSYTANVPNSVTSVILTSTGTDPTETIMVNGQAVASGAASAPIALNAGPNLISTQVTAQDSVTKDIYAVTITRAPSTDANLSNLTLSAGAMSPVFSAGTLSYTATVPNSSASVTVAPALADLTATVTVNGLAVAAGSSSGPVSLNVGTNTITAQVTAQDGVAINTYTITVTRPPSSNANLSNLILGQGTISPAFDGGINTYTATVDNTVTSVTATPVLADLTATVTVNGAAVVAGQASAAISLNVGDNTIVTQVTAQDGVTINMYTLIITRSLSPDADLANLSINKGVLSPAFTPDNLNYTAKVNIVKKDHTVYTMGDSITTNGEYLIALASLLNNRFYFINAAVSGALTPVMVTRFATVTNASPDYVIILGGNDDLLHASGGGVAAIENNLQTMYTAAHNAGTKVIALTLTPDKGNVNWSLTTQARQDSISSWIHTAQNVDYVIDTYNILADPANAYQLLPAFDSGDHLHPSKAGQDAIAAAIYAGVQFIPNPLADQVNAANSSVTLTPVTDEPNATVMVNNTTIPSGAATAAIPISPGINTISANVTAQDGTSKQYTVTVTGAPSNNADLAEITASTNGNSLTPVFDPAITNYNATVLHDSTLVRIKLSALDSDATMTLNGLAVANGKAPLLPLAVGPNIMNIVVTAADGITQKTYTLNETRLFSSNANLELMKPSAGTVSPNFSSQTTSYTSNVSNATTAITITPNTADPNARITVNGMPTALGTASAPIALAEGQNTINTVVTAQDGVTTKTYILIVTRASAAADASLSNLQLSNGALSPAFSATRFNYSTTVGYGLKTMSITPTAGIAGSVINVNGVPVVSGTPSQFLPLAVGPNTISIVVTALDGITTQTYTLVITESRSSINNLAGLTLSNGTLSPAFTAANTNYTANVMYPVQSVTVTPSTADPNATVNVNGTTVASGNACSPVPLAVGANVVNMVVTAQNGSIKTYAITVTRAAPSTNANLSGIAISKGALSPAFVAGTNTYADTVTNGTTSVTVTAATADQNETVMVNGAMVTPGKASGPIMLNVGYNVITIIATAQDGVTTNTFTITVLRPSTNAKLAALSVSGGTLSPAFNPNTRGYTASVPYTTSPIALTPTAAATGATIKINGAPIISGTASVPIAPGGGTDTITITVTAEDGITTFTYLVTIRRTVPSANANLSGIALNKGVLSPAFASATTNYTDIVNNGNASVTLTPTTADPTATVTVNGMAVASGKPSGAIALSVGSNAVAIIVTAQDGTTMQTYSVNVVRPSANAKLSSLKISSGALSPAFSSNITGYTASVTSSNATITVTPTTAVNTATISVNGVAVTSGAGSQNISLAIGVNNIIILVTAQDGITTNSYNIAVTRANGADNSVYEPISVQNATGGPQLNNDGIMVHQGVSPNGDGINDFLQIDGLTSYPDNRLMIMNRNGGLVYEVKNYNNSSRLFDGHSNINGQMQLPGTYFYSLDYTVKGIIKHKTGFIVLKY